MNTIQDEEKWIVSVQRDAVEDPLYVHRAILAILENTFSSILEMVSTFYFQELNSKDHSTGEAK